MKLSRAIFFVLLLVPGGLLCAQDENNVPANFQKPRFSIHANGAVPHTISNKAFKRSFTGIYDISASFNVRMFSGFTAGFLAKFNEFKTPDNKIPGLNTYGQMFGGGFRLAYYHYLRETTVLYGGVTAGEVYLHYFGLSCLNPTTPEQTEYRSTFLEPELGISFYVEGNFAIGIHTSFDMYDYVFDPYAICLNQHKAYLDSDLVGGLQHLNLGFGLTYSFLRK
ncbi:MAG: hypothetical protein FD123_4087 [Bacteroidetes bacterium]|nr:MAG: hypothetical protein FD123_4087 [Bacteroidota bacterium]